MNEFIQARRVAIDSIEVSLPHTFRLPSDPPMEYSGYLRVRLTDREAAALVEQVQVAALFPARGTARA